MQLRGRASGFVRTEGGLLPADLLERVRALDRKLPGLDEASYGLARNERFGDAIARSWNKLVGAWATFQDELAKLPATDPATTTTRQRFLVPLFEELGYGSLSPVKALDLEGKAYPVSHAFETVPLHLVGANVPLDRRSKGIAGAAGQSPHGLVQELLNRSPERLWGTVTNGRTLRILRDNASLVRQAYVEFDVEAIMAGEAYADFALLWHLAHRTRLEPRVADGAEAGSAPTQAGCYLERWSKVAEETGARARDRLRDGVQEAIEALGSGFLAHRANTDLKTALETGKLSTQDYYRELLRLVYRFILLFVAEDRDLLLDPKAEAAIKVRYARYYSTARLRNLAERRKGSRHADLYAGLRVVITALGSDDGAPGIGLPPLGGFLFGPDACPHLDPAELANSDLLEAIRKLATIEEKNVLRTVDYRNLGSEELGSIYESLLELHPELDTAAADFKLTTTPGHERKTTGSYYTPSSLISVLLDSALEPVLAEAADKPTKEEAERALLGLSVVDPAAGSGHFLVAAAHRIAKRLAQVRTDEEEPAPAAITTAIRDVIGRCLYAVDINPMAVELCKVSLWLEALEPGKPLTFLDAHIKCGNSLLGTTPALIRQGIPDSAYDTIQGDDKAVAAALKKRNRAERAGQSTLAEAPIQSPLADLAVAARLIDEVPDTAIEDVRAKASKLDDFLHSGTYIQAKYIADLWSAAFVVPKTVHTVEITTSTLRQGLDESRGPSPAINEQVAQLADDYGFFHWQIEFSKIFADGGGFDAVLGNPPWDRVKLQEQEFFAERSPDIAAAKNAAARKRMIVALRDEDPALWRDFTLALRRAEGESHLLRDSGRYPHTGRGDINTYAVFAETFRSLVGKTGRAGVIVPTGIATDDTTKYFFRDLVDKRSLASLHGFENEEFVFPGIAHTVKFCLLTLTGSSRPVEVADFMFFARQATDIADAYRHFTLTPEDIGLLNPNTRTSPIFRSRRDAELTKAVYRRVPVVVKEGDPAGNPWRLSFLAMFHMANDSHLFRTGRQLEADAWRLRGNIYSRASEEYLPLYEAKMALFFDHRFGDFSMHVVTDESKGIRALPTVPIGRLEDAEYSPQPRYWIPAGEVASRLEGRWPYRWLVGWRDVTSAVLVRTLSPSLIPAYGASGKIHLALPDQPPRLIACLLANLASFAVDYVARQKLGGNAFSDFYLKQMPVLGPATYEQPAPWAPATQLEDWIAIRVLELAYTAYDLREFAADVGWAGPPFVWSEDRRQAIRAELDAAFMHLYGYDRDEVEHVLDSFWVVRDRDVKERGSYRTKALILDAYDAMALATPQRPFESHLRPGPGDPEASHRAKSDEDRGQWSPGAVIDAPADVEARSWRPRVSPIARNPAGPGEPAVPPSATSGPGGLSVRQAHHGAGNAPRRLAAERIARGRDSAQQHVDQISMADLSRATADPRGWLPEEAADLADLIPGRRVRHGRFGEGVVVEIRRSVTPPSLTIRFDSSDHREIAIGFGLLEFKL
jgi:type I restriction-modification system DNA methylase subunit